MEFHPARFLARNVNVAAAAAADEPSPSLKPEPSPTQKPALLILNQPVPSWDVFERLWQRTGYRLCADGGANRLYDNFDDAKKDGRRRDDFIPDIIHGDLDSLRDDVRAYYASKGVTISRDPDQYSTDFGKGLKQIAAATTPTANGTTSTTDTNGITSTNGTSATTDTNSTNTTTTTPPKTEIIILGTLAGRVDQGLGLLYEIYRSGRLPNAPALWLFSESSVSWVLPSGRHRVGTPVRTPGPTWTPGPTSTSTSVAGEADVEAEGVFTRNVGILPAFGPAVISTQGLEWDVQGWETSVGGRVSTSNHVVGREVRVETDREVLFTIEIAEDLG